MRSFMSSVSLAALLVTGVPALGQAAPEPDEGSLPTAPPDQRHAERQLCRTPAALPLLGPETGRAIVERQSGRSKTSDARVEEAAVPPPPPPVSAPVSAESGESIVVTGSRVERRAMDAPTPVTAVESEAPVADRAMPGYPTLPAPPRRQPPAQSGLLTAGEHDDLLNPELYADYVRQSDLGQKARDVPLLDTSRVLTVEAKDRRGRPMPFVPVEVRCADGNAIILKTVADGRAVFFPAFDRLGSDVRIRVGNAPWRDVSMSDDAGGQTIGFTLPDAANRVRQLDLALVVDVTGSMADELRFLQAELTAIVDALNDRHRNLDIRVGFTFYRDEGDAFVTRTFPLDDDMDRAKSLIGEQSANGGGDYEEAMQDALIRAANQDWRDDAVKTLLLVADAPPHDRDIELTWRAAEHLRAKRVHIVPVGASGVADMAEYLMRAMAASTQSRYTFLTDDSGIGNPHAEPAIDCYLVTLLDSLLRRVIDSQISGRRIEPDAKEIIRQVGRYDAGRCVLPAGFGQG